jgi:hypothetical protein
VLQWDGTGNRRAFLYWPNPPPIYPMTYIWRSFPSKKLTNAGVGCSPTACPPAAPTGYYSGVSWGNNGPFSWSAQGAQSYYDMNPYPVPAPQGEGSWEISVNSKDCVNDGCADFTAPKVSWDRWHIHVFRAQNNGGGSFTHEFYFDWDPTWTAGTAPACSTVPTRCIVANFTDGTWATQMPPVPAIFTGQMPDICGPPPCTSSGNQSWGGYPGWEEFKGIMRGYQFYTTFMSLADIAAEVTTPKSSAAGLANIWYLNLDPRPSDVTDKKATGTAHNGVWACPAIQATCSNVTEWSSSGGVTPPAPPTGLHVITP